MTHQQITELKALLEKEKQAASKKLHTDFPTMQAKYFGKLELIEQIEKIINSAPKDDGCIKYDHTW